MAVPVNNTVAAYFPPQGEPLYEIEGLEPRVCTIVSVGPTDLVCAVVQDPTTSGPYSRWVAENVPYVDGDTDVDTIPQYGGYVAPTGFAPPGAVQIDLDVAIAEPDLAGFDAAVAPS